MKPKKFDFAGWATRYGVKCSDGRTIKKLEGTDRVPLVWSHMHDSPEFVLGHADLDYRDEGIYAYCSFNNNQRGIEAKEAVSHGDVNSLSIFANQLKQDDNRVVHHGLVREVSLVLAGANPMAHIDYAMAHSIALAHGIEEDADDVLGVIYSGKQEFEMYHEEEMAEKEPEKEDEPVKEPVKETELEHADGEIDVTKIYNGMTDEQKQAVKILVGLAVQQTENDEEDSNMKQNAFDEDVRNGTEETNTLSHDELNQIVNEARNRGSLKDAFLAHGISDLDDSLAHSITNIGYVYPDYKNVEPVPSMIKRDDDWVSVFMGKVKNVPWAKIRSIHADITADDARAKGYITGNQKQEEVFALLKRETTPTTVYKLQKMDRDVYLDIANNFEVVPFMKREMQMLLREEVARAALVGDGRLSSSNDKVNPLNIRPIWTDTANNLYAVNVAVDYSSDSTQEAKLKHFIRSVIKARKNYKGSGNPIMFTTEDMLTDLLLLDDGIGHPLYDTEEKLARRLRVSQIVTVPVMENLTRTATESSTSYDFTLQAIIVNPVDYVMGTDRNGNETFFDNFDLNFNKNLYLLETRKSGALNIPHSALVIEDKHVTPTDEGLSEV